MNTNISSSGANITEQLQQAARASQNGDVTTAKQIVADILRNTQTNADAWYLFGYLADDPTQKREALQKALAINPQHSRALQLMGQLQANDPFAGILGHQGASPANPAYQPPPIVVNVHQANTNTAVAAVGYGIATTRVNQTAMIIGFICAIFGIFGVAQLITGKIGGAVVYFFGGLLWAFIAVMIVVATAGLGACLTLPLHFYIAYYWSKKGATETI